MCIIMLCEQSIPKLEVLKQAESMNRDGAGIAWIENDHVTWSKGLSAEELDKLIHEKNIQTPCIIHFRIGTVGKGKSLCHPFPITKKVDLNLAGSAHQVLFHNGHWSEWKDLTVKMIIRKNIEIPDGKWSDSRAMTLCTRILGKNFLNFLSGQKIAILTPKGIEKFGDGWVKDEAEKCIFSNDSYKKRTYEPDKWDYMFGGHRGKKDRSFNPNDWSMNNYGLGDY